MRNKNYLKSIFIFYVTLGCCSISELEAAWTIPTTISTTLSDQPDISVDKNGNAVAIWQGFDGSNYIIEASSRPNGGSWTVPVSVSEAGENAQAPLVCMDALGNAIAVWNRFDGTYSRVQTAQLPLGGSWSAPINISSSGANANNATLGMDAFGTVGNAVAVWHRFNGSNFVIQGATLPSGGSWSAPTDVSASGQDALIPKVAVDKNGNSVITCILYDGSSFDVVSASQVYSQVWGPNFTLSLPGDSSYAPTVRVDSDGNAVCLWSEFDGTNNVIYTSTLVLGSSWSSSIQLSAPGENAYTSDFVMDDAGNIHALWVRFDGLNYILQSSSRNSLGEWSATSDLSVTGQDVGSIDIEIDPQGNCVAIWDISSGSDSKIQSARLPKDGSWTTAEDVSTPNQYAYFPTIGIDSAGNSVAIWLESDGTNYVVKGSTLPFGG